ncbi:hypothetical protein OB69_03810 [Roseivirga seohaensis subsp. aquiponti]|uniref:DUF2971 domain-containing protein n=1 Tax=Roseivirga seohaensis subsp. aquiponti TaxID=1566026 RepID=A0A0L8AP67_9BACT|nr:DUF2971 domain-containing protein [Roseivirga seohaensis]KOF04119.1 hypothetical protein OB69_03810 [Roseivirga seohaensis subsp. aquiponti]
MKTEPVYKYRSGNNELRTGKEISDLERDIRSIEQNSLFASSIDSLNDPCEALVFSDKLKRETKLASNILGGKNADLEGFHSQIDQLISSLNEKVGIYSLAGRYNHELLWAHYANSHKGFCVEYDLYKLQKGYSNEDLYTFRINYSSRPPQLSISDITSRDILSAIKKVAGSKSKEWKYEDETRIVFDKPKLRHYHPKAIIGIYFGLRMPTEIREDIMKRLSGRDLKFYEIIQTPNTYCFERREISNYNKSEFKYLEEIPNTITGIGNVSFTITHLEYFWSYKKGLIETEFEKPVSKDALRWLAELIKNHLFREADRVFMMHRLKGEPKDGICWSNSNYILGAYEISIYGITSI